MAQSRRAWRLDLPAPRCRGDRSGRPRKAAALGVPPLGHSPRRRSITAMDSPYLPLGHPRPTSQWSSMVVVTTAGMRGTSRPSAGRRPDAFLVGARGTSPRTANPPAAPLRCISKADRGRHRPRSSRPPDSWNAFYGLAACAPAVSWSGPSTHGSQYQHDFGTPPPPPGPPPPGAVRFPRSRSQVA